MSGLSTLKKNTPTLTLLNAGVFILLMEPCLSRKKSGDGQKPKKQEHPNFDEALSRLGRENRRLIKTQPRQRKISTKVRCADSSAKKPKSLLAKLLPQV
jgi:hypothetical protein